MAWTEFESRCASAREIEAWFTRWPDERSPASLAGHLLWREVDPEVVMELLLAWNRARCRPPLEDAEVAGVVESIARLHRARRETTR